MPRTFSYTTEVFDEYTDFPQTGDVDTIYIDASKNKAYRYDQSYYPISSEGVDIWGAIGSLSKGGGGGGGGASWGSINGTLTNQTDLQTALDAKQDDLVSGTNIKTINGISVLGSGDLTISGSGIIGVHSIFHIASGGVTSNAVNALAGSNTALITNRIYASPYIPAQNITTQNFFIQCTTLLAGALGRICVYSDVNGVPTSLLYSSANLDLSTIGKKTASTTFNFVAGTRYWLSFHSSATASITMHQVGALFPFTSNSTGAANIGSVVGTVTYASGAPSTFPAYSISQGQTPMISITKA